MNTFDWVLVYIAGGVVGLVTIGLLGLWWFGKMMSDDH